MNCPRCGEICRCHLEPPPLSPDSRRVAGDDPACGPSLALNQIEPEPSAWRGEISARLHRYRARRRMSPPRYPSLQLQFDAVEAETGTLSSFEPLSDRALALDGMHEVPPAIAEAPASLAEPPISEAVSPAEGSPVDRPTAKILEFPRFAWAPPSPPPDQLAEPVTERPRILEVPEAAPPPPALGGITIEAVEPKEVEKRPGIDIPLQAASLQRRILAGAIDGLIVATASALFSFIFWKVTAFRPPLFQIFGLGAAVLCLLWAGYQYLLIVYSAGTPGLLAAGLRLSRFDGSPTSRSQRRWRVLASYLSAASLGMGYAWVFLDEDVLCWHDRTTHTYLAPKEMKRVNTP